MASQTWNVVSNKKNTKNSRITKSQSNNVENKRKILNEKDINEKGDHTKNRPVKKVVKVVKPNKKSLEEAFHDLDVSKLEDTLKVMIEKFPDSRYLWLKEVSAVFNSYLEMVPMPTTKQLIANDFDHGINLLSKRVYKILMKNFTDENTEFHEAFLIYCLDNITGNNAEVCSCYGYYIIAKLIIQLDPKIALNLIESTVAKISKKAYQVIPSRILIIFDIFGHVGFKDFGAGVKVWNSLMLRQLNKIHLSSYSLAYIVKLMDFHNEAPHQVYVSMKDFFPIYDIVFCYKSVANLSVANHKSLKNLFPRLRDVCFEDVYSLKYFPSYLIRLQTENIDYRIETFKSIVKIMENNNEFYNKWYSLFEKNVLSSKYLIQYLNDNWNTLKKSISKKLLLKFLYNLKELIKFNTHGGFQGIDEQIDNLIKKINTTSKKWKYLTLFILSCLAAAIYYDTKINSGFKNSKSNEVLKKSGILPYYKIASEKTYIYTEKSIRWTKKNVPFYFELIKTQSLPYYNVASRYSIAFYEKSKVYSINSYEISSVYLKELYNNIVLYFDNAEEKWPFVFEAFNDGKEFCYTNLMRLKSYVNNDLKITLYNHYNNLQNITIYYYDLMLPYVSDKYHQMKSYIDSNLK